VQLGWSGVRAAGSSLKVRCSQAGVVSGLKAQACACNPDTTPE